ncbi:hypothetical protein BLNAU_10995 [Blattamonas nauphoetae]|uniref:Uncharacterized protein n=1 Tax=Blattamonas nauphoetae TaxID=2049346 RepID=A0ABQ9XR96_9EUKA|nr:hypothetical protein BLNAU_10995 [Blattamonas nauphoetae]
MGENNSSLLSLKKKLIASKLYLALRLHSTNQASPFTSPFLVAQDSLNIATSKEYTMKVTPIQTNNNYSLPHGDVLDYTVTPQPKTIRHWLEAAKRGMIEFRKDELKDWNCLLPHPPHVLLSRPLLVSSTPPRFLLRCLLHDVTEGRGEEVAEHQHSRLHIATLTEYTRAAAPSILLHSRQTACPVCGLGGAGVGAVPKCRGGVAPHQLHLRRVSSDEPVCPLRPSTRRRLARREWLECIRGSLHSPTRSDCNIVLLNRVRSTATNIPLSTPVQLSHCISRPILRPRCSPLLPHSPIVPGFDTATRLLLGGQGTVQADHLLHVRTDTLRLFTLRLPPPLNECALVMLSTKVLCEYKQVGVHQQSNVEFFQLIINRKDPAIALVAAQFLMEYSFILKD